MGTVHPVNKPDLKPVVESAEVTARKMRIIQRNGLNQNLTKVNSGSQGAG